MSPSNANLSKLGLVKSSIKLYVCTGTVTARMPKPPVSVMALAFNVINVELIEIASLSLFLTSSKSFGWIVIKTSKPLELRVVPRVS